VIPFISLENKISLSMLSDELYSLKGFVAEYQSVFIDGACSQMVQLTNMSGWFSTPNFPSNYPGSTQCGWNISIPAGYKIYLTFLEFELEECGSSCTCDYVEVSYHRDFSNKRCGTIPSGGWEVKDFSGDSVMVKFKSDSRSNKKGFEAIYTFVSLDGWDSIPPGHCPWTESATAESRTPEEDSTTDSIKTAIARTAQSEEPSTADDTNPSLSTADNRNSAERRQFNIVSSLVVLWAIILLSHCSE